MFHPKSWSFSFSHSQCKWIDSFIYTLGLALSRTQQRTDPRHRVIPGAVRALVARRVRIFRLNRQRTSLGADVRTGRHEQLELLCAQSEKP